MLSSFYMRASTGGPQPRDGLQRATTVFDGSLYSTLMEFATTARNAAMVA
jgi:hypothetical protein